MFGVNVLCIIVRDFYTAHVGKTKTGTAVGTGIFVMSLRDFQYSTCLEFP